MRSLTIPVLAMLLVASSCLTQSKRNKIFAEGVEDAFVESKMAEQYLAYVAADASLSDSDKGKRTSWVARVKVLLDEHKADVVSDIKFHMLTNGICAQYDAYIDADPNLRDTSKEIRKRSSEQIRKLIKTAEGS